MTDKMVNFRVWAGMLDEDEFMPEIVIMLETLSNAHVGLLTTLVPTNVAHPVARVGVIVDGNVILTMPVGDRPSVITKFMLYDVVLPTVEITGVAVPVKVDATALMVAVLIIFANPFLIIFTVMAFDVLVEGGHLIL